MATIRCLKANVTREDAIACFQRGGLGGLLRRTRSGHLRSVAEAYVPFRLYPVEIRNGARSQRAWFALDAVDGSLDLYRFDAPPEGAQTIEIETRNRPEAGLPDARAVALLEDKVRRAVFQSGFFRIRDLRLRIAGPPVELNVPYWLGFYGSGERVRLRVLDAVRRRFEGAKARALFEAWLAA
jgi:hypothetical protein